MVAKIDEELWFGRSEGEDTVAEESAAVSMAARIGRIVGAKTFPRSAKRLAELTRDDRVRIEPVVGVLESDPALSAKLLRLVNSAGYGLRMRCTSVRHAATLVGTDRLHQIATTAAVLDMFDQDSLVAARVIEHSTVVGALSRYLGSHLALPTDDLFTCGFLHDIGKLMMLETEGELYLDLLEEYQHSADEMHSLERDMYGFDHAVLAAHVLKAWEIPDPVPKVVAFHHSPARAYKSSPAVAAMVQTLRLADSLFYALETGAQPQVIARVAQSEAASYLEISEPQLAALWTELEALRERCLDQARNEPLPVFGADSLRPRVPLVRQRSVEPKAGITGLPAEPAGASRPAQDAPGEERRSLHLGGPTDGVKQLSCVVCGEPTFGNLCSACGGHVCPAHQSGREDWCAVCREEYELRDAQVLVPVLWKAALAAGSSLLLIVVFVLWGATLGFATISLLALATLLGVVFRSWHVRRTFLRYRLLTPSPEPPVLVTSMVPPPVVIPSLGQVGSLMALLRPPPEVSIRTLEDVDYTSPRGPSGVTSSPPTTAANPDRVPRPGGRAEIALPEPEVGGSLMAPALSVHPHPRPRSLMEALKRPARKLASSDDLPAVLQSVIPPSGPSSSAVTWPPEALAKLNAPEASGDSVPPVTEPLRPLSKALPSLPPSVPAPPFTISADADTEPMKVGEPTTEAERTTDTVPVAESAPISDTEPVHEAVPSSEALPGAEASWATAPVPPAPLSPAAPASPALPGPGVLPGVLPADLTDSLVAMVADRVAAEIANRVAEILAKQVVGEARDHLVEVVSRKVADAWRPGAPPAISARASQAPERPHRGRFRPVTGRREPPV